MTILLDGSFTCLFAQHLAKQETQAAAAWWVRQVYFRIRNNIKDFDFSFSFCVFWLGDWTFTWKAPGCFYIYIFLLWSAGRRKAAAARLTFFFSNCCQFGLFSRHGVFAEIPSPQMYIYIYTLYVRVVLSSLFVTTSSSSFSGFGFQDESRRACCSHFFFF